MIVTKNPLSPEQLNIVRSLSERSGVSVALAKILYARGIDTVNKVKRFLSPGKEHFRSPMLLKGMAETVERLTEARDNGETVVIYGDYDSDGVCASAIMYYALREFGIDAIPVVPERADGYGLGEKLIDKVMEEYNPDLIITVDCGISGYKEVEYVHELGVDIIVTDHHELPEVLPDCTIVNCKLKDQEYDFDCLCGAGVAFKVATALIGSKANKYLDLAALATVADSMPLVDENRDIVAEGLRMLSGPNIRPAFKAILDGGRVRELNSTALAYSVAPRVNAAGRMGDAHSALRLFLSDSSAEIFDLAARLGEYNMERQAECDSLYTQAKAKLLKKGAYKRVIVLEGEGWKNGLIGIVAARLAEEFTRPVILFVNTNGFLHGSARSIEQINILDAISHNKEFLTEFGGHSQAAGVSMKQENIDAFEDALDAYISENYPEDVFVQKIEVEDYIEGDFSLSFARELEMLEPFGTGNKRPMFALETSDISPQPLKEGSPHIKFTADSLEMIYFSGAGQVDLLRAPVKKTLVFEPNLSVFRGRESFCGYVRTFEVEVSQSKALGLSSLSENLRILARSTKGDRASYLKRGELDAVIDEALTCPYGTLFAVSSLMTLKEFPQLKNLPVNLHSPRLKNLANCVVLTLNGGDLAGFKRIIYLDNPLYEVKRMRSTEVYVNEDSSVLSVLPPLDCSREGVGEVFTLLKQHVGDRAGSFYGLYESGVLEGSQITRYQFIFAAEVLGELGIFAFEGGRLCYDKAVRADLSASKIYTKISQRR